MLDLDTAQRKHYLLRNVYYVFTRYQQYFR